MNNPNRAFRDRLVDAERYNPGLKQRYEKEMESMFEKRISPRRRVGMIGIVVMLVAQIAFFSYALLAFDELPLPARFGFVLGILFSASFMVVMIHSLRSGIIHLRNDSNRITVITWLFIVALTTLIMLLASRMEPVRGVKMTVNVMIFFMFGVVCLVKNTIEQEALKTREKLLEIKYRIADLMEKADQRADGGKE